MADQNPLPEDAGGGFLSGEIMGIPTWMFLGGIGVVAVFLYLRSKKSSGNSALAGPIGGQVTPQTAGGAVDPYTGQLIDPFTGQPYTAVGTNTPQQGDLSTWITAAEKALTTAGYQPGAIASAIYNYTQGNPLSPTEAGIINKALGLVGYPPIALPFLGTVPKPKPPLPIFKQPKPHLPVPTGSGNGTKLGPLASLPAAVFARLGHNEHILGSVRLPSAGPSAGYYFSNLGGVFAVGGAPFLGSYFSLPAATRNIPNRTFNSLQLLPGGGYRLISSTGEKYAFPKPVAKAKAS